MFDRHPVRILNFKFVISSIARNVMEVDIGKGGMKDVKCSVSGMKKKQQILYYNPCSLRNLSDDFAFLTS